MVELSFYIGVLGNIISVFVFLAPVKTFFRIVKRRSTEEFESLPYVCMLLNTSLWTYYGIIKSGEYLVATVNGFGDVVEIIYLVLFLIYAPPKMRTRTALLVGILNVGFIAAAIVGAQLGLRGDTRTDVIGFMCAGLNTISYGSPLAAMKTVITTKSVEFMPFLLSFFLFLNGLVWTCYALLVMDFFLVVPNGAGFLLGTAQLILYAVYRRYDKPSRNRLSEGLEEASPNECLIASSSSE
ncbi:hypothetical protein SLA2020_508630 [Shorea laevis]